MVMSIDQTALIMLDLQNEMVHPDGKIGGGGLAQAVADRGVLENAAHLLAIARDQGVRIVHVRLGFRSDYADVMSRAPRIANLKANQACQIGAWGTEFHASVSPLEGEYVVTKQCVNPFYNTGLMNYLHRYDCTDLILCGTVTNLVVESATRAADDAGFAVTVVEDACAAPNAELHEFAVSKILPMFGRVETTEKIAAEMRA
ncbi:MAG: cysteine hydrolase [Pseudomonadota bacterium]